MALITLDKVSVAFEGREAVANVSFSVSDGDYLVILGENGSGKTTLMRAMLSLVKIKSGRITYGKGITARQIGYLPQKNAAHAEFPASCEEVVLSGCCAGLGMRLFYSAKEKQRAQEKMRLLDVEGLKKRDFRTLSGGQQQRVLLARALCATDKILLMDEPVTGLDPEATADMYRTIRRLNEEHGVAVVMISHDKRDALNYAKNVLVVNHGVDFFGSREAFEREAMRA